MTLVPEHGHAHDYGSPLSHDEIYALKAEDLVVIDPFKLVNLGVNSYDVTLGEFFYREQHPKMQSPIYNIYDSDAVERVWGHVEQAVPYLELVKQGALPPHMRNLDKASLIILIAPGETILAHTEEFVGGRVKDGVGVTANMHTRSTIGRSMLGVCKCSGFGDGGYITRWTMEITSFSQYHWVPLLVGSRVAQMEFQFLKHVTKRYDKGGKYCQSGDVEELRQRWTPDMMLPRLHKDREFAGT